MSEGPDSSTSRTFREAAVDTAKIAGRGAGKVAKVGLGAFGLVGTPFILATSGVPQDIRDGRFLDAAMDTLPVLPEIYEVGLAGVAIRGAMSQGIWAATRTGGAALITGSSLAVSLGGGLVLALAADLGSSALHDAGYDVDPGYISSHFNGMKNLENIPGALFAGDNAPFQQDFLTRMSGMTQTMTQTGPYQWKTETTIPNMGAAMSGVYPAPTVIEGSLNQTGIGNFFENELKFFSTFHGHYGFVDKDGKEHKDKELNDVAQAMYENRDQAFGAFREILYDRTLRCALDLAKQENIRVNGGQVLTRADVIPPDLLKRAGEITLNNFRQQYNYAGNLYLQRGLSYVGLNYTDQKDAQLSRQSAYQFITNFPGGASEFKWNNPDHCKQLKETVERDVASQHPIAPPPQARPHRAAAASVAPLATRLSADEIHGVNLNVLDQAISGYLAEAENPKSFDPAKIHTVQNILMQAGHLSATHVTGNLNGYTMRALDRAIKSEMDPTKISDEQRPVLEDKAKTFAASLKESPADPTSFDPRVLAFQTNSYLLGHYDGKLDGLGGPKTMSAMQRLEMPQQAAPIVAASSVAGVAPALEPAAP